MRRVGTIFALWLLMLPVAYFVGDPMIQFVFGTRGRLSAGGFESPALARVMEREVVSILSDNEVRIAIGSCGLIEATLDGEVLRFTKAPSQLLNSCTQGATPVDYYEASVVRPHGGVINILSGSGEIGFTGEGAYMRSDISLTSTYNGVWWLFMVLGYITLSVIASLGLKEWIKYRARLE